ncbi:MAG: Uma2 family endonuclease [Spirulina sp. SIO3F2]|nr:Uma2 family endonuclease [Spirulina sp. SIO3F2]
MSPPTSTPPHPIISPPLEHLEAPPEPDISHLVLADKTPVDNLLQEKLQRLLVQCLYDAFIAEQPFVAMADVGLFFALYQPPLVPDVMLSLGVEVAEDWEQKRHRSYLMWEFGKPPEVVIEIVSNKKGQELDKKLTDYARIGVAYYVVFDPLAKLSTEPLLVYGLREGRYQLLDKPWLPEVGLGLTLWSGEFENKQYSQWLRWCDQVGNLLLTGREQAEQEKFRADQAEAKLARLAEWARSQGVEVDELGDIPS